MLSCVDTDKVIMVESTGRINHVLVVMKNSDWDGDVGTAIRNIVTYAKSLYGVFVIALFAGLFGAFFVICT